MQPLDIEIRPLAPADTSTFVGFLGRDAFADNPKWANCYCYFPHGDHAGKTFDVNAGDTNRAAASAMVQAGAMRGYFAFVDGHPVAWCNANLIENYTIFDDEGAAPGTVGAIGCFIVVDRFRRKGIAGRLLQAALDGFRAQGVREVLAFPLAEADSEADNHLGPVGLYLAAGFEEVGKIRRQLKLRKRL